MSTTRNRTSKIEKAKISANKEAMGCSGLKVMNGKVVEDVISLLKGFKKIKTLEEMIKYDPTIGGVNNMISALISNLKFEFKPANDSKKAEKYKKYFDEVIKDFNFEKSLEEAMTYLPYGFSLLEPVYKKRNGEKSNSLYNDGYYGIADLEPRYQGSVYQWQYDSDYKNIINVIQKNPNSFSDLPIPYSRLLHFTYKSFNRSPEGQSLFQNCVEPWYEKKITKKQQIIRHDRGFDGFLEIKLPANLLMQSDDAGIKAVQKWAEDTVENMKAGSGYGVVSPHYSETKIHTGGQTNIDPEKIIARCDKDIATALISDFFLLTQKSGSAGSFGTSKIKILSKFVKSLLKPFMTVFNKDLVMRLCEINGFDKNLAPTLKHNEINDLDLTALMLFLQSAEKNGLVMPDAELSQQVLNMTMGDNAPKVDKDGFKAYQDRRETQVYATDDTLAREIINNNDTEKPEVIE